MMTCHDCGACDPCDDDCPNHVEPAAMTTMGLIDHPLTPLIVAWLEAVNRRAAFSLPETRDLELHAQEALNAALEKLK